MSFKVIRKILSCCLHGGLVWVLCSCATTEEPQTKVHRAAMGMDNFAVEQGMPLREVQKKEFYFKHCELETRRAFTSKAEFSCNDL
ncbi:MAG: hypothetical protein AABY64_14280 [Bdellovibrionota bacterium]